MKRKQSVISSERMVCGVCNKSFVTKHTCLGGTCSECMLNLCDLSKHTCPVRKVKVFDAVAFVDKLLLTNYQQDYGETCTRCLEWHAVNKNANGFRNWRGSMMCADCFANDIEITSLIEERWIQLLQYDVKRKRTICDAKGCNKQLISILGEIICRFERDHIDVFSKKSSVSTMVNTGVPMVEVLAESDKCRNLCVRCHSFTTFVERHSGILRLKKVAELVNPSVLTMATRKTNSAVARMLVRVISPEL